MVILAKVIAVSFCILSMIKNEGIECTVRGNMDFAAKPILEGGERY